MNGDDDAFFKAMKKTEMLEKGEWRAAGAFKGHASFHIWAGYSMSPNASWAHIARR